MGGVEMSSEEWDALMTDCDPDKNGHVIPHSKFLKIVSAFEINCVLRHDFKKADFKRGFSKAHAEQ